MHILPCERLQNLIILIVCVLASVCYAGTYSGVSGTEADPYLIASVADWQELVNSPNDCNEHFILTTPLNFQGSNLTPISNFTGVFDGQGFIVRNAVIHEPNSTFVGLFLGVGEEGRIDELGLEDVNVSGYSYVGGI